MSYRAFKRLLGETSLGRKCVWMLGTGSLVLITGSFVGYARLTERIAYNTITTSGRLLIGQILYSEHDKKLESRPALDEFQKRTEQRWPESLAGYKYAFLKPNA